MSLSKVWSVLRDAVIVVVPPSFGIIEYLVGLSKVHELVLRFRTAPILVGVPLLGQPLVRLVMVE